VDLFRRQTLNRRYTALLIGSFVGVFALLGLGFDVSFAGYLSGGAAFPYVTATAVMVSAGISALAYYGGGSMVLRSLLARPLRADDPEHRELSNIVNEIAIAAGLPRPEVFVIPEPSPNALAIGRDPEHAAIALTEGALALLDREETQGVVAHELSHVRNRDTLVMTVVAVLFGGIVMLSDWGRRTVYYARQRGDGLPILPLLLGLLVVLSPLLSRLLAMAVSRQREYLADATAVELTRNPAGLIRALQKIERSSFPLRGATRGSAHLFIVNPLKRRIDSAQGTLSDLLSSHPPIAQRIAVLRSLAGGTEA